MSSLSEEGWHHSPSVQLALVSAASGARPAISPHSARSIVPPGESARRWATPVRFAASGARSLRGHRGRLRQGRKRLRLYATSAGRAIERPRPRSGHFGSHSDYGAFESPSRKRSSGGVRRFAEVRLAGAGWRSSSRLTALPGPGLARDRGCLQRCHVHESTHLEAVLSGQVEIRSASSPRVFPR